VDNSRHQQQQYPNHYHQSQNYNQQAHQQQQHNNPFRYTNNQAHSPPQAPTGNKFAQLIKSGAQPTSPDHQQQSGRDGEQHIATDSEFL
jgi:hypothetical protein